MHFNSLSIRLVLYFGMFGVFKLMRKSVENSTIASKTLLISICDGFNWLSPFPLLPVRSTVSARSASNEPHGFHRTDIVNIYELFHLV